LVNTFSVPPATEPTVPESFNASITVNVADEPLLASCGGVSLSAPVVPLTRIEVGVTSLSAPVFAGAVTLSEHVSVALSGKSAAVPLLAVHAPTVTDAPGTAVDASQTASSAVAGPVLRQTIVPVTVCPGAIDGGNVIVETISALVSSTVIETIARSHAVDTA
jgi:hypothetical protein